MSTLYVGVTTFQLITILNMRVNMNTPIGDLIISERSIPDVYFIKDRIIKKGLFNNVFVLKNYDSRLSSVLKGNNSICEYLELVYKRHFTKADISYFISEKVDISFEDYDEVFLFNREFFNTINKYKNIKINMFDEGLGAYTDYYGDCFDRFSKIYLYEPQLAVYYERFKDKMCSIPVLDDSKDFISLLNYVWGYKENIQFGDNAIIVADQPFKLFPRYYDVIPAFFKKYVFARSRRYKKFLNDRNTICFLVDVIKSLLQTNSNIIVKMHPRSGNDMRAYYEKEGLKVLENTAVPWEIIFLNLEAGNVCLLTMYSTVVLGLGIYFGNSNVKYKSAFLYEMAEKRGDIFIPKEVVAFLSDISQKLPNVKVVKSNDDLEKYFGKD